MILLNSIWLFALAALSIPVAIHLWNIRQGKTLKVGSIELITASSQKSSRSFKLRNILLLLLRCLLLALVAFILAMPFWQRHINSAGIKGWILVPKENIKESYQKFKSEMDSLTKAGYEFHYFNKGFQKADISNVLADSSGLKTVNTNSASYWSLVQQLDGQVPSSLPLYLFTPNGVAHFNGVKPQVSINLHWQTYVPADSASSWIAQAWLTNNNDIQVVEGNTKPSGTYYTNYTIRSGNQHNTPFVIKTDSGRMIVGLKNANSVIVDTSTWHFAIYSEKNAVDAGYVKAALESIIQFTKHKAIIKEYADAAHITTHQNWIFWLTPKPVNQQQIQNCDNLFIDEAGKVKDISSWIDDQSEYLSRKKTLLYKMILANHNNGEAVWRDGFGDPILSLEKHQQTNIYHFYSRFDPAWSDLVWSDDFPKMLLRLIVGGSSKPGAKKDYRIMDAKQLLPVSNNEGHTRAGKRTQLTNLTHYCWLLLVLVFVAERWLAHKKKDKQVLQNG
jgi:hypothetical protein